MQEEILEKNPAANVKVYAVWLPMIASDARSEWKKSLIPDSRVIHLWDEQRVVGRWFAAQGRYGEDVEVVWDIYFLFGPEAQWETLPDPLVSWGRTVVAAREKLRRDFLAVLNR